jgi:outer membrane protein assembly factor BamD (BamD/ComL family)
MTRRALSLLLSLAALGVIAPVVTVRAADDPRFSIGFVQGLRERGYYELALEYMAELRSSQDTPKEIRDRLDFEEGRTLTDAATHGTDPEVVKKQLEMARGRLEAYIKANEGRPEAVEARVDLAHLLYERGRSSAIEADEAKTPADKEAKLVEARGLFGSARAAYDKVFEQLTAKFKNYPNFLDEGPLKAEKERTQAGVMNADLQRAVVDYEEGQTFPIDSPQRKEILERTGKKFEDVYKAHRTQLAGITARMWQGKCYEDRGDFGAAKAIYDELLEHADPRLRPLQKKVDYFRILLMGKRKEYALAADEALNWLKLFPNDRRSFEALGIQLELAKDILAQLPDISPADKDRAIKRAADSLSEVVRVYSPFKAEALAILQKIAPKQALKLDQIANLKFDDAEAQATSSVTSGEYDKAITIFRVALRKGVTTEPVAIEKLNKARYTMAYALYMSKRYYEAAALAEHVARRYPNNEWGPKASEIAMVAFLDSYNNVGPTDRPEYRLGDLARLDELAKYAADTWPQIEQGDMGRMTAGNIALGSGKYLDAIKWFEAVRPESSRSKDAQGFAGDAHWKQSLTLRAKDPESKEADAEVQKSIALFQSAIKARKADGAGDVDLALISNLCDLATIDLEIGKPDEALKLIEPSARALGNTARTPTVNQAYARILAVKLRGHVGSGQVDLALGDMNTLEKANAGGDRAQLYFELGKLLEKEMENLRRKKNTQGLERTQQAYRKFLEALVNSKSGQTYESLMWAGSNLLKLGAADQAAGVFDQILKIYGEDSAFLAQPGASQRILLVKIRQVAALRGMGSFDEAEGKLAAVIEQDRRLLEAQMEKGYLLSAKAAAKRGTWAAAITYWERLAQGMRNYKPRPVEYYEAWYQAAKAHQGDGKTALAKQTLNGIMRLSRDVGTPEMKAKYQDMLGQLK